MVSSATGIGSALPPMWASQAVFQVGVTPYEYTFNITKGGLYVLFIRNRLAAKSAPNFASQMQVFQPGQR